MSSDTPSGLQTDLDPSTDFREAAGATATAPAERSVSATARAELANKADQAMALDRHEEAWMRENERLSGKAHPIPGFDLGSRQSRDLKSEYETRHDAWKEQGGQIREHYQSRHTQIRINGQTVKDEFTESSNTTGGAENALTNAFKGEGQGQVKPENAKALSDPQPIAQSSPQIASGRGRGR